MKQARLFILTILLLLLSGACSHPPEPPVTAGTSPVAEEASAVSPTEPPPQGMGESADEPFPSEVDTDMHTFTISIGGSDFSAKLYDSDTTAAFLALLPMTLQMSELNGNEKYHNLPNSLPTDSQSVGSIHAGDLMLYGSDCLVLFYESFTTTYRYTKLGHIESVSGLADALGDGNVEVTFTLDE